MPTPLTVVLNLQSIAMPQILNPVRVDVATQDNPTTIVVSETDTTAGHPARIWSFPGLPRTNYVVTMSEISGGIPVNQLAYFDVVPDNVGNMVRDDEQLIGGVTPDFNVGLNQVFFDGHDIPGSGTGNSTLAVAYQGNLSTDRFAFTFSGITVAGDIVTANLNYDLNNIDGVQNHVFTSTVLSGWGLTELINDLMTKITANNPNVINYTDGSGNNGLRVKGFSTSNGAISVVGMSGTPASKFPDYRGWNINPERRAGGGTMQRGTEYSWNPDTGEFDWLISGDGILPNELYNIDFDPIESDAGGSVPPTVKPTFTNKLITANYTIVSEDLGTNLIIEPAGDYLELTLPAVSGATEGLPLSISVFKTATCCVKIIGTVKFEYGASMFLIQGESVELYCFIRSTGNNEWRYRNANAAFASVGQLVYFDSANPINAVKATGTLCNNQKYARLLQWVQALPPNSVQDFNAWSGQQTYFSTSDGTNFYVPNRTHLYPRTTAYNEDAGGKVNQQISSHKHLSPFNPRDNAPFGKSNFTNKFGDGSALDSDNDWWFTNDGTEIAGGAQLNPAGLIGTETRPNSFLTNQFILI
jgi:hypothetical protein